MTTLPNNAIGLNSANIADANIPLATWEYVAKVRPSMRKRPDAPTESLHKETGSAPLPRGTVGKEGMLRRSILQMSLAPHISSGAMSKVKSPSRVG